MDRREYIGSVWEQIDEAFQFVLRNIHLGAKGSMDTDKVIQEFDPFSVKKLLSANGLTTNYPGN